MKELKDKLKSIGERLDKAERALKFEERRTEISELEGLSTQEDFWNDRTEAERVMKEIGEKKKFLEPWEKIENDLKDLSDLLGATEANDHKTLKDLETQVNELGKYLDEHEFALLMTGEYDDKNALLSVHAGAGGTDAQDWGEMLLRMYTRFAESEGWSTELLHVSEGEEAGIKSATMKITGSFAYGYLKGESGVHRLVRISPFDADKARHTSFALVDVIPDIGEDIELEINEDDLKIEVFRSGGAGGQSVNTTDSAVRITHLPTGITVSVQNERSQLKNKQTAMGILKTRLHSFMKEKQAETIDEIRGEKVAVEWGSQIRSYVLHPYTKVKDHRTEHETGQTEKVLEGELMPFIEAFLRSRTEKKP